MTTDSSARMVPTALAVDRWRKAARRPPSPASQADGPGPFAGCAIAAIGSSASAKRDRCNTPGHCGTFPLEFVAGLQPDILA
jgi:hypothetical protein